MLNPGFRLVEQGYFEKLPVAIEMGNLAWHLISLNAGLDNLKVELQRKRRQALLEFTL